MHLDEFKLAVRELDPVEAARWRSRYISTFVNTAGEWYRLHIDQVETDSLGPFYSGYLWECLNSSRLIPLAEFQSRLEVASKPVFVMWDLHSPQKIRIPDYWKFGRDAVLLVSPQVLSRGRKHLSEDLYIFDETLSWSLISTHEQNAQGHDIYLHVAPGTGAIQ